MKHLAPLTGVRFLAAIIVVLFHFAGDIQNTLPDAIKNIILNGYVGVQLFFVLSGFILAYSYYGRDVTAREFWLARFARIYPVYAVATLIAIPIFLLASWHQVGAAVIAANISLVSTLLQAWFPSTACNLNCPSWSLSVEAFFYALFPLILLWARLWTLRQNILILAASVLICALPGIMTVLFVSDAGNATAATNSTWLKVYKFNPLLHLGEFLLGVAAGALFLQRKIKLHFILTLVCAALIVSVMSTNILPYVIMHTGPLALVFGGLIYGLAHGGSAYRLLSTPTMLLLGEASYSMYILHVPLHVYVGKVNKTLGLNPWPSFLVYLAILIVSSVVSYKMIEVPTRRWIQAKFARPVHAIPAPADV